MLKLKIWIVGELTQSELTKIRRAALGRFPRINRRFPFDKIEVRQVVDGETKSALLSGTKNKIVPAALKFIEENATDDSRILLLVNDPAHPDYILADLPRSGTKHGFAHSSYSKGCAIVFAGYDKSVYTTVIHELWHTLWMKHCSDTSCVMFDPSLVKRSDGFCPEHRKKLKELK